MEVIYTKDNLTAQIRKIRKSNNSVGFVPTMGALHQGHLSLISASRAQNDITVASIFVNPTQFNDKEDLKRYPRMPEKDQGMLLDAGCDILFMPGEKEVYPEPDKRLFDFGGLDKVMEGKQRPGHFNGVAQVVTRLFDMVTPDRAYFGIKDFQQLAIIRYVAKKLGYPVKIVACPIVRESDGLAMSSRNMLLSPDERKTALILSKTLFQALELKQDHSPAEISDFVNHKINSTPEIMLEYFQIVNGSTLMPVSNWDGDHDIIGCIAARVGKIRLIDNINFS